MKTEGPRADLNKPECRLVSRKQTLGLCECMCVRARATCVCVRVSVFERSSRGPGEM